ncbi:MAG: hypothetical protein IJU55_04150 [Selenomonadaceae bacterium]|nr:hypothetical protein [Selenomonadaceae bacterium]
MDNEKNFSNATQNIRIKLADMVNAGKNPFEIILELAKFLGEISGEQTYSQNISEQISAVYGLALNEKFVLEKELAEVSARLEKIKAAQKNLDFTEEERKRMGYAIERHKAEIERLKNLEGATN